MFNQRSSNQFVHLETKFEFLLQELQKIWDEVGVPDVERDTMILTIEQECMEVFRTKVDNAKKCKVLLQQQIASYEAELVDICSALGEQPPHFDQNASGSLKKKLETIIPQLEDMKMRKVERRDEFFVVLDQLQKISIQICRSTEDSLYKMVVEETDLSLKRLEELRRQLLEYQDEKRNRVNLVMDHLNILNSLCLDLGMDFKHTIHEIHPTLDDSEGEKDVTNNTVDSLANLIQRLRKVKIQRWLTLQNHASALLEMWNLMDTPIEQQTKFQNVTRHIAASESEITEPNMLSTDFLNHVEEEVSRLQQLKSSKLKEIFQKKRLELEEICRQSHMVTETLSAMEYSNEALESGTVDPTCLLEQIELQITRAKEEALSRKEILEKFEKWLAACQDECWLEEYNRDDNRYNAGRGAHLTLKRAEKARALVNKIPGLVEALTSKTTAWERERGLEFLYDGGRLLSMLTEYSTLRQEKEQEKQRQRDMKRFQGQVLAEQEVLYGSKRSPSKSGKKASNRKMSLGGALIRNQNFEKATPLVHPTKKGNCLNRSSSHQRYGVDAPSSGRRISEISGHSVKKHPSSAGKALELDSPLIRKPLSPVLSEVSSKVNIANFQEGQKTQQKTNMQAAHLFSEMPIMTPSKPVFVGDEENRTPKTMPIPVPLTPKTMSVQMLTATTPATPFTSGAYKVEKSGQPVEYSFEEVRAGFIHAKSYRHDASLTN
ncbi:hypothetical protein CerSpe_080350 [Prunus speciosa]